MFNVLYCRRMWVYGLLYLRIKNNVQYMHPTSYSFKHIFRRLQKKHSGRNATTADKKLLTLGARLCRYCTSHKIQGTFSGHHCSLSNLITIGRKLCRELHEVWKARVCGACTRALITWKMNDTMLSHHRGKGIGMVYMNRWTKHRTEVGTYKSTIRCSHH